MYDNYNYPPGADNEFAPWNQVDPPEHEFDVTITQTLSKSLPIVTTDYNYIDECDEDGRFVDYDTTDTHWEDVYEREHHTPAQLIAIFKRILENNEELPDVFKKHLIKECSDWIVDEYVVTT